MTTDQTATIDVALYSPAKSYVVTGPAEERKTLLVAIPKLFVSRQPDGTLLELLQSADEKYPFIIRRISPEEQKKEASPDGNAD